MTQTVFFLYIDAYDGAKYLCDQYYLGSPDVNVKWIDGKCFVAKKKTPKNHTLLHVTP